MKTALLAGLLSIAAGLFGQNVIPAGTILPLRLNSSLNSRKSKPGQIITARLMQDVPLPSGARIRAGAKAIGSILEVDEAENRGGAKISLRFDTLEVAKRKIPITANLRALASMTEVQDAQLPASGPDRGTSESSWTTVQIGGDVVYRGGGPVVRGLQVVGVPAPGGVLVRIASKPAAGCRGEIEGNDRPQALWVFSADACGVYGFPGVSIAHAGRTDPIGRMTLQVTEGELKIPAGSGMLLRVDREAR